MSPLVSLRQLKPGQRAVVRKIGTGGELGRRMREMGLVPGTVIQVIGRAAENAHGSVSVGVDHPGKQKHPLAVQALRGFGPISNVACGAHAMDASPADGHGPVHDRAVRRPDRHVVNEQVYVPSAHVLILTDFLISTAISPARARTLFSSRVRSSRSRMTTRPLITVCRTSAPRAA